MKTQKSNQISHLPFPCGSCCTNQVDQIVNVIIQVFMSCLKVS